MGAGFAPGRLTGFLFWKCRLRAACDRLEHVRGNDQVWERKVGLRAGHGGARL